MFHSHVGDSAHHPAPLHQVAWRQKAKGQTLGNAYLHINFWDVAKLEQFAWAIYDRMFVPGRVSEMLGYQDWDHIVVGSLVPLIYQGEMVWDHYGPATIARVNAHKATDFTKEQVLCYKEKRALSHHQRCMSPCLKCWPRRLLLLGLR